MSTLPLYRFAEFLDSHIKATVDKTGRLLGWFGHYQETFAEDFCVQCIHTYIYVYLDIYKVSCTSVTGPV